MRKLSITLLCSILLITVSANVFAQKTDFSGKWKIDEKRSDFGHNGTGAAAPEMIIIDKADFIAIERGWNDKPLYYNGKVLELVQKGGHKTTRTLRKSVKRAADGASIIMTMKQIDDRPDLISTWDTIEVWTLSADKNELTIKWTMTNKSDPKPDLMTFVYTRVQ